LKLGVEDDDEEEFDVLEINEVLLSTMARSTEFY